MQALYVQLSHIIKREDVVAYSENIFGGFLGGYRGRRGSDHAVAAPCKDAIEQPRLLREVMLLLTEIPQEATPEGWYGRVSLPIGRSARAPNQKIICEGDVIKMNKRKEMQHGIFRMRDANGEGLTCEFRLSRYIPGSKKGLFFYSTENDDERERYIFRCGVFTDNVADRRLYPIEEEQDAAFARDQVTAYFSDEEEESTEFELILQTETIMLEQSAGALLQAFRKERTRTEKRQKLTEKLDWDLKLPRLAYFVCTLLLFSFLCWQFTSLLMTRYMMYDGTLSSSAVQYTAFFMSAIPLLAFGLFATISEGSFLYAFSVAFMPFLLHFVYLLGNYNKQIKLGFYVAMLALALLAIIWNRFLKKEKVRSIKLLLGKAHFAMLMCLIFAAPVYIMCVQFLDTPTISKLDTTAVDAGAEALFDESKPQLKLFKSKAWGSATEQAHIDALQTVANIAFSELGVDAAPLMASASDMSAIASYSPEKDIIWICRPWLAGSRPEEAVKVVLHECYHKLQQSVVNSEAID